jgi:hypothetical protein
VRFASCPSQAAGEGKEVGDIVNKFDFYVLGGDAVTVVEHLLGDFASNPIYPSYDDDLDYIEKPNA